MPTVGFSGDPSARLAEGASHRVTGRPPCGLCPNLLFRNGHQAYGIRTHPRGPMLTQLSPQRPVIPKYSYIPRCWGLGLQIRSWETRSSFHTRGFLVAVSSTPASLKSLSPGKTLTQLPGAAPPASGNTWHFLRLSAPRFPPLSPKLLDRIKSSYFSPQLHPPPVPPAGWRGISSACFSHRGFLGGWLHLAPPWVPEPGPARSTVAGSESHSLNIYSVNECCSVEMRNTEL